MQLSISSRPVSLLVTSWPSVEVEGLEPSLYKSLGAPSSDNHLIIPSLIRKHLNLADVLQHLPLSSFARDPHRNHVI